MVTNMMLSKPFKIQCERMLEKRFLSANIDRSRLSKKEYKKLLNEFIFKVIKKMS